MIRKTVIKFSNLISIKFLYKTNLEKNKTNGRDRVKMIGITKMKLQLKEHIKYFILWKPTSEQINFDRIDAKKLNTE